MSDERQLYRIKRGSFTRRDGAERAIIDHRGHETGKYREHVLYSAKSMANMDAKDEVHMTDEEADKFGRHRLERLIGVGVNTIIAPATRTKTKKEEPKKEDDEEVTMIAGTLFKDGQKAKSPKEKRDFRRAVVDADIIDDVPEKHTDILEVLRELA